MPDNEKLKTYYEYLDGLRASGVTNMFGARPYLQAEFPELTEKEASGVLSNWMKTFGDRLAKGEVKHE